MTHDTFPRYIPRNRAATVSFTNGANSWSNPYRYDGHDGARYDAPTGLYWLSVWAYDPSVGRFLSRLAPVQ